MKTRSIKLYEPESHFSNWAYKIERWHYPALGVSWCEYVVRKLCADGNPPKNEHPMEASARAKKHTRYACWAESSPIQLDFALGDVFHNRANENLVIQVSSNPVNAIIEVTACVQGELNTTTRHTITQAELATWLKTGRKN